MSITGVHESLEKRTDTHIELNQLPLAKQVKNALEIYFQELEDFTPSDLYRMVIDEVEKPLLETVMKQVKGNQTRAAEMLGLNRSTLRKKLQLHNI